MYEFISKCVVVKPEERLSIDDGLKLLRKQLGSRTSEEGILRVCVGWRGSKWTL
jgi:hypothetical protein